LTRLPVLVREWVRARATRDAVPRETLSLSSADCGWPAEEESLRQMPWHQESAILDNYPGTRADARVHAFERSQAFRSTSLVAPNPRKSVSNVMRHPLSARLLRCLQCEQVDICSARATDCQRNSVNAVLAQPPNNGRRHEAV
jgi:hypothetical protein